MATELTVTGTSWVTPRIRRVHFHSGDLSAFAGSDFTDRYVKIVFLKPGVDYPEPLDLRALRGTLPPEQMPDVRTYTALFPDVAAGTLAIDFVIHGDEGVAGPWAAGAEIGDTLLVNGPGGAYRPGPDADWHLLVGDESALPAVIAALDALPEDAVVRVVLAVDDPAHEPHLALPADGVVRYVYREDGGSAGGAGAAAHADHAGDADRADDPDAALVAAVRELEWPAGRVHAFVHGEAQEVMHGIRPYLFAERGLARDQVSISGYWRRGRTEDSFRVWKSELARTEST